MMSDQPKIQTTEAKLIEGAKQAMAKAYAPYSNYPVGALVVTQDGQTFVGCNVENASYPEGHCAETAAIAAMVMAGQQRIQSIYIMSQDEQGATPCGGCRQRIREFADNDTPVFLCSPKGVQKRLQLSDLLPHAFGPEFLI
ncbi:cytidine deaminase [Candidatus Njordibacter sp. Uisw_002]|uniref:cytidine deaminase n=1 Tax=Candidatus Njordibacter sp. Uisw_002 TaxID=3230971 RepID=UPI003D3A960C